MNGRRPTLVLLLVVGLAALHFILHVGFGLGRAAPDLLTVALLVAARHLRMGVAAAVGFAFGIMEDALSLLAFGANALSLAVVGALGAVTRDLFVGESLLFVVSYLAIGKWLRDLVHWMAAGPTVRGEFVDTVLIDGTVGAAYVAVVGVLAVAAVGGFREGGLRE